VEWHHPSDGRHAFDESTSSFGLGLGRYLSAYRLRSPSFDAIGGRTHTNFFSSSSSSHITINPQAFVRT
jgi:hypothetical protein